MKTYSSSLNSGQLTDLIRSMPQPLTPEEARNTSIKDVGKGGFINISGNIWYVEEVNRYEESWKGKTWKWFELKLVSLVDGKVVYLEWEQDDELEVFIYNKTLRLGEIGLTRDDLTEIDDEEDGEFFYDGQTYYYEDSGDATFFRDGAEGESYYYWDFYNGEEDVCIYVENWGGDIEAGVGFELEPREVVVLVKGG